MKEENYYELFLLELATGLHLVELMALQWDDLDMMTEELRINKQVNICLLYTSHANCWDDAICTSD